MKKIVLLLAVLFSVAMASQAQVKFGLKGGLNLTDLSLKNAEGDVSTSNRAGFFFGPTVRLSLPVVGLGFDASALYNQRSSEIKEYDEKETIKQQTVAIPVNVRYGVGLGDLANAFLFAGPQFDFNVGSKTIDKAAWRLKNSMLSVNVGAGVTLLDHLQITANYNIGCGNTGEATFVEAGKSVVKGKSNTWQIAAAYYF